MDAQAWTCLPSMGGPGMMAAVNAGAGLIRT